MLPPVSVVIVARIFQSVQTSLLHHVCADCKSKRYDENSQYEPNKSERDFFHLVSVKDIVLINGTKLYKLFTKNNGGGGDFVK